MTVGFLEGILSDGQISVFLAVFVWQDGVDLAAYIFVAGQLDSDGGL